MSATKESVIVAPGAAQGVDALSKAEVAKLYRLGWKKEHYGDKLLPELRIIIQQNKYRPGSDAYLKHAAVNPLTGTKGVDNLIGNFSDEAIAERTANVPDPSGVEVVRNTEVDYQITDPDTGEKSTATFVSELHDDWWKKNASLIEKGEGTCFDHAARPHMKAFPQFAFRWLSPAICERLGTDGFEPFRDPKTGQRVELSGQYLGYRPIEVERQMQAKEYKAIRESLHGIQNDARGGNFEGAAKEAGSPTFGSIRAGQGQPHLDREAHPGDYMA